MFDFIRKHTRIALSLVVLLIIPSFVFFGIEGYSSLKDGANSTVAVVDSVKIKQAELDAAHRRQVDALRAQMPNIDVKMFDTPQMRRNTLDALVREQVMLTQAVHAGYAATDEQVLDVYLNDPQFAPFRNPDGSVNVPALEMAIGAQGLSKQALDQRIRQQITLNRVQAGIAATGMAPAAAASGAIDAMFQQREVQLQRFSPADYLAKVNPSDADIESYYKDPSHAAEFQVREKADIEYVVLDLASVSKDIKVPEEDLKQYYAANEKSYTVAEERRASHILVKERAKADQLLAELKKNPSSFADVARKNSQDTGSAAKGGDVDLFIARGDTDKAYEDALFAMQKPGDLSEVAETKDGFYILQLKTVRGGEKRPYESVRAEIETLRKNQLAQAEYAKAAADFGNMVYEQSDSLKPVAEKYKLEVRKAAGVTRSPAPDATGPLASAKLLEGLFSDDALRNKRNTEAVEIAPSTLVSARIDQYTPASTPPLAEVRTKVRDKVAAVQAAALARREGEARLAALRQAPATDLGTPVVKVSRAQPGAAPREVLDAVLRAPANSLPAVAGVELGGAGAEGGYVVARITKVLGRDPVAADATQANAQYAQIWTAAESQAYYDALKSRYKVKVTLPADATSAR